MSDKLYEEFNNISFDEAEFDLMEESLTDMEIKKLKNNISKRVYKKNRRHIKIVASIVITAIMGITLVTPTFAKAIGQYIPGMEAVYEKLGYYQEYKEFSQYIGESKEVDGYTFTIDRLVADNDTVLIGVKVSKPGLNAEKKDINKKSDFMMTADLTGIRQGTIMSGGVREEVLDENTSIVLLENYSAPGKKMPKRFNIRANIHNAFASDLNVNFDLPVSREKIEKETIIKKNLGESDIGDEIKVNINQVKVSPINTSIEYSYDGKLSGKSFINFYTFDDKGRVYSENSGGSDDSGHFRSTLNKIEPDAKKIYIIPYVGVSYGDAEVIYKKYSDTDFYGKFFSLDTKREFIFDQEGTVNVYKIEKVNNNIKFYYSLKGFQSVLNKRALIYLSENNGDKPENKRFVSNRNTKLYKLDTSELNNFCVEFQNINPSKDYVYSFEFFDSNKVIEGSTIEVALR